MLKTDICKLKTSPLTEAMTNEIVGGRMDLTTTLTDIYGTSKSITNFFFIRGKNALDVNVDDYFFDLIFNKHLLATDWWEPIRAIARHESIQSVKDGTGGWRIYNQFNTYDYVDTSGVTQAFTGTPNMSSDKKGWGIGQITETSYPTNSLGKRIVPTAAVWNWKTNVNEMVRITKDKIAIHNEFMGDFARTYGNHPSWTPPPAMWTQYGRTLPTEMWGAIVLYNGGGGITNIPVIKSNGVQRDIQSPITFNPGSGQWEFHDNENSYGRLIDLELKSNKTIKE